MITARAAAKPRYHGNVLGRRHFAWFVASACAAACQRVDAPKNDGAESEPRSEARQCGEAGSSPTPLPSALASGVTRVGEGELGPGESKTFGTVVVSYHADTWLGTTEVGQRGNAIDVRIDRAEVGEGRPWGHTHHLRSNGVFAFEVGPYRFEGSSSDGDPPERVKITVERRACPDYAVMDDPGATTWLWVSTDGLQAYTLERENRLLQVAITAIDHQPRIDLSYGYGEWKQSFVPTPGEMPRFRADDRMITIEEIVPGLGTRYTDAWAADGIARAHARVRIEPAEPIAIDPAIPAATRCGDPTAARTELPTGLASPPKPGKALDIAFGSKERLGTIALEVVIHEDEAQGPLGPEVEEYPTLELRGSDDPMFESLAFASLGAQFARVDDLLVRAEEDAAKKIVRVRSIELACPAAANIDTLFGPTYVWLSTIGHDKVTLDTGVHPRMSLQLHPDQRTPTLNVSTEYALTGHALFSTRLEPEIVGKPFTVGGATVQIVDVVAVADTALVPLVHVQVRIDPAK
jgi:hypothetical protein